MRKEKPIAHSDTAKHKNKAHIKTHKGLPAPEGMLRGWWSAWMGAVITLELCVRSLRDEIKSLPLSSQSAPSTKEHHFPREKDTVCVYIHVCVWSDTQIRQKSSDTEKRLEIHTPGAYDKGNWMGASVCKRLWETQKDRLSTHKRDCASNFAVSPGLLTESCTHSSTLSRICANRFHFTELVCSTKSSLEQPAWLPCVNIDRFTACHFLIFTCCY